MEPRNPPFTLTWGSLWRVFFLLLFVWILLVARDIIVALFLALVISSALEPIVSRLEEKKIPRILSTLGIYIIAVFAIALMIYTVVPLALSELHGLLESTGQVSGTIFEFLDSS